MTLKKIINKPYYMDLYLFVLIIGCFSNYPEYKYRTSDIILFIHTHIYIYIYIYLWEGFIRIRDEGKLYRL